MGQNFMPPGRGAILGPPGAGFLTMLAPGVVMQFEKKTFMFFFKHVFYTKKTWPPKKNTQKVFFFFNTHLKEITS